MEQNLIGKEKGRENEDRKTEYDRSIERSSNCDSFRAHPSHRTIDRQVDE